jgi:hypothetical protein
MAEYKLSYTGAEIDEKLGKVDSLVATVNGIAPDKNGNVNITVSGTGGSAVGLTTAQINALNKMFEVCAYSVEDVSAQYSQFRTAFGLSELEDTAHLTGITATYSGGAVVVGTDLAALTGITVTATYSDGHTANVTGYTLSGTIIEGDNTITVTYGDTSTTINVVGVLPNQDTSNGVNWVDGVAYTDWNVVKGQYVDNKDGSFVDYNGWTRTSHLYCLGASKLRISVLVNSVGIGGSNNSYNAFYDENKNFIKAFDFVNIDGSTIGSYEDVEVPANAAYFIVSHKDNVMGTFSDTSVPYISITPYA